MVEVTNNYKQPILQIYSDLLFLIMDIHVWKFKNIEIEWYHVGIWI